MKRWGISGVLLAAGLLISGIVLAHEGINVGPYVLEVGWLDEPPLVGVKNGVFLGILNEETGEPVEGLNTLEVTVSTGGKDLKLNLRPLGEDTPGQYAADFIPTRRGVYAVKLTGQIEETDIDVTQEIEEVVEAASIQFPEALPDPLTANRAIEDAQAAASSAQTLAIIGTVVGAIGVVLAVIALGRRR